MSSLDDFFAKKDNKNPKKKKTNFLATNELYKTLEESTKLMTDMMVSNPDKLVTTEAQLDVASSGTSVLVPLESGLQTSTNEDDEDWCDFNENNRWQYTHSSLLRISQMGLTSSGLGSYESDSGKSEKELKPDTGGDGLGVGSENQIEDISGAMSCPWQKSEPTKPNSEVAMEIELTTEEPSVLGTNMEISMKQSIEIEGSKKQIYVPPALRQSKQSSTLANKGGHKGQAPDLNSSEYFPALSDSKVCKRGK